MKERAISISAKGWLLILIGGGSWGITFSLAKIATGLGAHPLGLSLWQGLIGGGAILVFNTVRWMPLPSDAPHLVFYVVCGLLGTALPGTMYFYAADQLPAGVLSIVIALVPIMSFAIAASLGLDRPTLLRLLGVGLGFAAMVLMIAPETSLPAPGLVPWILLAAGASACYAIENSFIALRKPPSTDSVTLLCGMMIAATLALAPVVALTGSFVPLTSPLGTVELCVVAMALINIMSYGMFVHLVTITGPVFASQMAYIVTISGVFWGIVIFGEEHSVWIWTSLVIMLVGLVLVKPVTETAPEG
jgi:drug/metabolite transporter (DMT)-like permease